MAPSLIPGNPVLNVFRDFGRFSNFKNCALNFFFFCREYVQRAFASAQNETEKDRMEALLKEKLQRAFDDGSAATKDWANEPLPV